MKKLNVYASYTLLCIAWLTIMVGATVAPGLITIASGLGVPENPILLMTLPALGAVIFAPFSGQLIDRYGAYPSLSIGLFLYGLLGASVYFMSGPLWVYTNRILLGGATSLVMAGCTVLISHWYFGKERLHMMAKQGMSIELGGVVCLLFGGLLAAKHWALPLLLYLIAWIFFVMLLVFVPRQSPKETEKQAVSDDLSLVRNGLKLTHVYMITVLSMVAFFTAIVLLPITMHEQHYEEERVGFLLAFISLIAVVAAHFMPKIVKRFGEQKVLASAFICYSLSYLLFLQLGAYFLIIGAVFNGIGFGLSIPLLNHMTVERSHVSVRGRNLSYFTMSVFSGQFLTSFIGYIPGGMSSIYAYYEMLFLVIVLFLFTHYYKAHKENKEITLS